MRKISIVMIGCIMAVSASAQTLITQSDASDRPQIDIESYSIEATIDPFEGELVATADIRFVQLDRENYVVFDLDRRLRVRDVYLGEEEPLPVRFRQFDLDSTLEVDLSDLGQFDQPFLHIEYDGILNPEEGRREPILSRIASENAFLLYDAKWFPLNGLYRDSSMMELNLTVPSDWQVVTSLTKGRGCFPGRDFKPFVRRHDSIVLGKAWWGGDMKRSRFPPRRVPKSR